MERYNRENDYYDRMYRLGNEYRALINKARAMKRAHNGEASADEAVCYQKAAEICGQCATLNIGAEAQHWIELQGQCSASLREIEYELNARKTQAQSLSEAEKKKTSEKTEDRKNGGKNKFPSDEMIESWFKETPRHGFDKVAGMEDVKERLKDCVLDVSMSGLSNYLGMDTVQAFLFYGLPGCGKTYIIEAFAHELIEQGYHYMSLSGADIHNSLSGQAEKVVEAAFREAESHSPCILFIDEIDGVCRNRSIPNLPAHIMSTTTSFLTGFNSICDSEKRIIFIGATNYPQDVDSAMRDRMGQKIKIPLPDKRAREFAFEIKLKKIIQNAEDLSYADIAEETQNYNYREINQLVSNLKKEIKRQVIERYNADQEKAIEALKSGRFCLTKDLFVKVKKSFTPESKDAAVKKLDEYEAVPENIG